MKAKFLILYFFFYFISCSSLDVLGYKNLGNHYFLWEGDHYKYSIIWTPNDSHAIVGGALVINNVVKYDFNEKFIIAKTTDYITSTDSINKFWLIYKNKAIHPNENAWNNALTGPLDSIGLIRRMRRNDIKLILQAIN